jgi:hypothetical protein
MNEWMGMEILSGRIPKGGFIGLQSSWSRIPLVHLPDPADPDRTIHVRTVRLEV